MEGPKISIITVNLNNLQGLKRTVESVLNQTWKEFEYIVIDGGSTDGSKEYLSERDAEIDYWVSEKDSGIYNGMNKGIKAAKGEYLLFLNSGDELIHPEALSDIEGILKDKEIIYFNLKVVDSDNIVIRTYPEKLTFKYFLKSSLPHPATFIKAICFQKFNLYDENLKISSDWKFFMEGICKYNFGYLRVDKNISLHYLDGISSDPLNYSLIQMEREMVLENSFPLFLTDYREYDNSLKTLENLRGSRKIKLLLKLNQIKKF